VVEKRGRGCPQGSKNNPNTSTTSSSSAMPAKRCCGRPLGRKNKKPFVLMVSTADHLDVSLAQPSLLQSSVENLFSFFLFLLMPNVMNNNASL
jgi:hypothetical protein